MGIYVQLEVNPSRITAKQWEDFYQESLILLRRFPVPLMRLMAQETPTGTRLVWTAAIVERQGMPDEHWVVDGDLETLYPDPDSIHHRLEELYRGSETDLLEGLARGSRQLAALARMKQELAGYKTLGQIGATQLIGKFLRLTGDPTRLIEFVEEANAARAAKTQFPLKELFRLTYTRFSAPAVAPANPRRKRRMKTQDDVFADVLWKLTGEHDSGCLIAPAKLLEAFATHAPNLRPAFERSMKEADRAREKPVQQIDEAAGNETLHGADYILQQVELQRETGDDDAEMSSILGQQLGKLARKHKGLASKDPHFYAGLLSRISGESGLPLREGTWARIDAENDVEILRRLVVLAAIDKPSAAFHECRKRILETPDSWPLLLGPRETT
ncbi:MAG: hypothetical protein HY820_44240 [Acidobacteria bacterium]|nr:hypothetical protein [Acidobacteriota bacterium]